MRRIHLILLAAIATMAMSAVGGIGASSALAIGPLWLVEGEGFHCKESGTGTFETLLECLGGPKETGTKKWELLTLTINGSLELDSAALVLSLNLGTFTLTAPLVKIECTHEHDEGTIVGGIPGKDHEVVTFLGCTVNGHPECDVNSPDQATGSGVIKTRVKTELVLAKKTNGAKNLLDLFLPGSGSTFVTLNLTALKSGACPIFTAGEQEVKGSVAAILEPETEKAVSEGMLTFPEEPIKKVFRYNGGTLEEVKVGLEVFGTLEAKQVGLADVWLEHGGNLGAHCGCL